uniref:UPAR/Ly6 domain-containing protein n=1 Tax=Anopheles epiroticus TaxID=199890 RepID=A0A182P3T6_9DIPT
MMKQVKISDVLVACLFFGALSTQSVSALRCYQCTSPNSWSDCQGGAQIIECSSNSQMSVMGHSLFLPAQARQVEPACLSVYAKGTVGGTTGYAYIRDCLYNDASLCSMIQDTLPPEIRVVDCDLCTTDLCNGANRSITAVTLSSVLMMAIAVLLWK